MEDKLLIWKLNRGSRDALCRIYDKYRDDLVRMAAGLANNVSVAEDVVQDVFLTLVRSAGRYEIRSNLKGYLTTCVANKISDWGRKENAPNPASLDDIETGASNSKGPDQCVACDEEFENVYRAMALLPYEQKEVVILHLKGSMKFREIAKLQGTSVKTTLSRYSYGLDKLRSILNSEVER